MASGTLAGLAPGDAVKVTPDDFGGRPVPGTLVAATAETVTIARRDARAGRLHLHFPRAGFVVAAA